MVEMAAINNCVIRSKLSFWVGIQSLSFLIYGGIYEYLGDALERERSTENKPYRPIRSQNAPVTARFSCCQLNCPVGTFRISYKENAE